MTGTETTFAAIAAEVLGTTPENVRVVAADTASAPFAGVSGGSKITYTVGRAVERAAEQARERILYVASEELEIAPSDLEIVDGVVRAVGSPDRSLSLEEIAQKALAWGGRYEPIAGQRLILELGTGTAAGARLSQSEVTTNAQGSASFTVSAPRRRSGGRSTRSSGTTSTGSS